MKTKLFTSTFALSLLTACGSVSTSFTKTGDIQLPALANDCPISIYTTPPKKEFDELGIVDLDLFYGYTQPKAKKASDVKALVSEHVCEAGGNAILLWEANGAGHYTKVTVIKTKS